MTTLKIMFKGIIMLRTPITVLSAAIACACAIQVQAQQVSSLMEEIIVTSQKREQTLQDTPLAITAFTGDQMSDLGIVSIQDIANFTPSMSYQEAAGGGEGNRIYIRGIGRETSVLGTEPGVGIYTDGFYSNESGALLAGVDRIERLEVLRGPQGTLYGRNTTGGAINVVSKRPSDEFEGTIRFNAGSYSSRVGQFTLSGPITDSVRYFAHHSKTTQDSFYTNVSGEDPIGRDESYSEVQLNVDVSDNINWNFRATDARFDNETIGFQNLGANYTTGPLKLGELVVNPELFSSLAVSPSAADPFDIDSDFQGSVRLSDNYNYQSTLDVELDGMTVRILNGSSEMKWTGEKDYDGTSSLVSYTEEITQIEESTQHEIQFISNGDGAVSWVAGLFYYDSELLQPYTLHDYGNPYLTNVITLPTYAPKANPEQAFYSQTGELEAQTTAIYGQLDWQVNEDLVITAGLRYSEDEKSGSEQQQINYDTLGCGAYYPGTGNPYVADVYTPVDYSAFVTNGNLYPGGQFADACPADANPRYAVEVGNKSADHSAKWDSITWRINASWAINDSSQAYATVSTGYKSGGFRLGGMQDDPATAVNESIVDEETLTSFEVGYKGAITDSLNVNAAAYFYDYSDMQVELDILNPDSGISTSMLANAPSVDVYGFEMEATWAATDNLTVLASYSYNESEITEEFLVGDLKTYVFNPLTLQNPPLIRDAKGNALNRSPKNKVAIGAFHVQPFDAGALVTSATYSSIDKQFVSIHNDDIESIDSYAKLDARISWKAASGQYEISVYGDNLTDEFSYANGYSVGNQQLGNRLSGRAIAPRTMGAELVFFF
jgi:iron complex outermembrane receptor protein